MENDKLISIPSKYISIESKIEYLENQEKIEQKRDRMDMDYSFKLYNTIRFYKNKLLVKEIDSDIKTPTINGEFVNVEIYKFLERLSNSVGDKITEYHWREICGLMKLMEDKNKIKINYNEKV